MTQPSLFAANPNERVYTAGFENTCKTDRRTDDRPLAARKTPSELIIALSAT
jgi:hypothetical protein